MPPPKQAVRPVSNGSGPPPGAVDVEPVRLTSLTERVEVERVELFSIDGVSYTVPRKVRPNVGLKALWLQKTEGEEYSTAFMLTELLGEEGFQALANYDDLTTEQFASIMEVANKIVFGDGLGKQ